MGASLLTLNCFWDLVVAQIIDGANDDHPASDHSNEDENSPYT
jgi:hypothetical protein